MPLAPLVIVNPAAGRGHALRAVPWIRERLAARPDARLEITSRPGDAERLARKAADEGHDRVVAVGGDGTVQEVVNGLLVGGNGTMATLGLVPLGNGNDLARSLGLPRELGSAWRVALGRGARIIDVAHARNGIGRERWFVSAGGIGFDAQVATAMASARGWLAGPAGYLMTTLAELRRTANRQVTIRVDDETMTRTVLFVAIANGSFYGGGMRIAPAAEPSDGRLDVCIVGDLSRMAALRQLPNLYRGTHVRHPAVSTHAGTRISIDGTPDTPIHLDGEPFGHLPLAVSILPAAVTVASPIRDER